MAEKKTARKDSRPRIDAVIRHIKTGSYDEDMGMLLGAIQDRQAARQQVVMGLVQQVFGQGYTVVPEGQAPLQPTQQNPFLAKANRAPGEVLPGESPHVQDPGADEPADEDPGPDYESHSPVIGSVETQPPTPQE